MPFPPTLPGCRARVGTCIAAVLLLVGASPEPQSTSATGPMAAPNATLAGADPRCPVIDMRRLSPSRASALEEARVALCAVLASDDFARRLHGTSLRFGCGDQRRVGGQELVAMLRTRIPDHWVVAGKPLLAEAATNPATRRIKIRKLRFDAWQAGGVDRSEMIDTLAHEWTHLIVDDAGNGIIEDAGHGSDACPDSDLASYQTGSIARAAWLARSGIQGR